MIFSQKYKKETIFFFNPENAIRHLELFVLAAAAAAAVSCIELRDLLLFAVAMVL